MCIETLEDLKGMEAAGQTVRAVLESMKAAVREGISTGELDAIGEETMR
jgi:methionine aminopeptidase